MHADPRVLLVGPALLAAFAILGCSDGRPDEQQVAADLSTRYPDVEVLSVRTSEDEVVAASFEFTYRNRTPDSAVRRSEVQYMQRDDGVWEPDPPLPVVLDR